MKERPLSPLVETESIVAGIFRVGEEVLLWKSRLSREIFPSLGCPYRDEKELDVCGVESRLHVSSQLNSKLPAQRSPEGPTKGDEDALVWTPHLREPHLLTVGYSEHLATLKRGVLRRNVLHRNGTPFAFSSMSTPALTTRTTTETLWCYSFTQQQKLRLRSCSGRDAPTSSRRTSRLLNGRGPSPSATRGHGTRRRRRSVVNSSSQRRLHRISFPPLISLSWTASNFRPLEISIRKYQYSRDISSFDSRRR